MMKHSNAGKGGFKLVIILFSIFIIFFSPLFINAQIQLNGFGVIEKIPSFRNKQKLLTLDYNNDSITDIISFGSPNERVTFHPGSSSGFEKAIDKFFYYLISDLKKFNNLKDLGQHYIFISRKEQLAGLVSFTKYGTLTLLNTINFNSYPSALCTGDINNDGKLEAIVSGKNFNGLSILSQNKFKLSERTILPNRIFSEVALFDLDDDKYPELIAIDELENSIIILSNNQAEEFRDERKIKINSSLSNLLIEDINDDGFIDIVFSAADRIEILRGDSVSSFRQRESLFENTPHSKFLFNDITNDGKKDFLLFTENSGEVKIAPSALGSFSEPFLLYQNPQLKDLIYYSENDKKNICLLDKTGSIYRLKNYSGNSPLNIPISFPPDIIGAAELNGINIIYYISNKEQRLVLIELQNNALPKSLVSYQLTSKYSDIKITDYDNQKIRMLCFEKENNFFDELILQKNSSTFTQNRMFTNRPVIDAAYYSNNTNYIALTILDSNLYSETFAAEDGKQLKSETIIDTCAITGIVSLGITDTIYYWTKKDSVFNLLKTYSSNASNRISEILFSENVTVETPYSRWLNRDGNIHLHGIVENKNSYIVEHNKIFRNNLFNYYSSEDISQANVFFDKTRKAYTLWSLNNQSLFQFNIDFENQKTQLINYIDYLDCKDYFVTNFSNDIKYLIYSNNSENYLTLQKIE